MTTSASWQPLLSGTSAEMARAAIDDLLRTIAQYPHDDPWIGLLYAYAGGAGLSGGSEQHAETLTSIFDRSIAQVREDARVPLYGGFTGIGWAVAHLSETEAGEIDPNEEVDAALSELLARSPWSGPYDLISGLVGHGVYFLERLSVPGARAIAARCLELIVEHLAKLAIHSSTGATWLTAREMMPARQRTRTPRGYYNLGVAHGVPGIISFLGQVCEAGLGGRRARDLLDRAVDWLLAQSCATGDARFPNWIAADGASTEMGSRLAWCYGDLGIAVALLRASRCVNEPAWEAAAVEVARRAARRSEGASVRDAGLCHGTAGAAHLYNRLFQATGDEEFQDAARYWLDRTIALRAPGQGIAGYRSIVPSVEAEGTMEWRDVPGFLIGASGIGLALLAAVSSVVPDWDRVLLVSIPPKNQSQTMRRN